MNNRSALGKGLNALLPMAEEEFSRSGERESGYFLCPVGSIRPNPDQPRDEMESQALKELAASIREKGILQPLLVCKAAGEEGFELIAGERRLRAAKLAGLAEVPVVVKEASGADRLELALIENIQRQDLNPLEEARAYARLVNEFDLTQEEVAVKVGKERSTVANVLRILNLPDYAKEDLAGGAISLGHARVLLSIEDPKAQRALRDEIVQRGLSVRQAEQWARNLKPGRPGVGKKKTVLASLPESYCKTLSLELGSYLGTKSRVIQNGSRGTLQIEYYSPDDLERLLGLIVKH